MSYIAPNGNIWLLHNVPIDKSYQNTLYWDKTVNNPRTKQKEFFVGTDLIPSVYVKKRFSNQYYTRHEQGSIRINELADNLLDCNYLVFQNTSFGTGKYFYAFITSVEYVNNSVTQVNFEIDVIQTWYFDFVIEPSFLERTHVNDDTIYSNIVPEPVEPGEYTYEGISIDAQTSELVVIASYMNTHYDDPLHPSACGYVYGRIYGGTLLKVFEMTDSTGIDQLVRDHMVDPDNIVSIYVAPKCLLVDNVIIQQGGTVLSTEMIKTTMTDLTNATPARALTFGSYTPHNNKLYSYPFSMLEVFTPEGAIANYRYEFFSTTDHTPTFQYGGSILEPVEVFIAPKDYKVNPNSALTSNIYTESISLKNYPMCSWNVDAFKAWVAQNALPMILTAAAGATNVGISYNTHAINNSLRMSVTKPKHKKRISALNQMAMNTEASGNQQALVSEVSNIISEAHKASIAANQFHGQLKGSSNISMNIQGFFFANKVVNESSARIIDSYFDRFGYAISKISEVNMKNRKYFTYIKTVGCTLVGGVPSDDEDMICSLHDTGITYWDADQCKTDRKQIGDFSIASQNTPWTPTPTPSP